MSRHLKEQSAVVVKKEFRLIKALNFLNLDLPLVNVS